jgi:O-antigen ligase
MSSRTRVQLLDPLVLLGLLAYAFHLLLKNSGSPIKVGELALLLIAINALKAGIIKQRIGLGICAMYLCIFLGAWSILADIIASESAPNIIKTMFRMPLYFTLIIMLTSLYDTKNIVGFMIGFFAGDALYFFIMFPLTIAGYQTGFVAAGGVYDESIVLGSSVLLKWLVPNPVFILCILLCFNPLFGFGQKLFWRLSLAAALAASLVVETRTSLLAASLFLAMYLSQRALPHWRILRIVVAVTIFSATPLVPVIVAEFVTASDVYNSDFNSWSNLERVFMLDVASNAVKNSPLFGAGSSSFWSLYGPRFEEIFNFPAKVTSPHNLYAEMNVSWGIPAGLTVLALNILLSANALRRSSNLVVTSLALAVIAANYSVQPLADAGRLGTILLWFCAYFNPREDNTAVQAQTSTGTDLAFLPKQYP